MAKLGRTNSVRVSRIGPYGSYVDGGKLGEALLIKERPAREHQLGDQLEAFVFLDSDDTLVASTTLPNVQAGQIACLEVVALTKDGAFLDWGLKSDLFVPRSEQMGDMAVGARCVVLAMLDKANHRMIASAKLFRHLPEQNSGEFSEGQSVQLTICQQTELGFKAVIDGSHLGVLYSGEIFQPLQIGQQLQGFIKAPRADQKIDVVLQRPSAAARSALEQQILDHLRAAGGRSTLTDKSAPDEIYARFGVSKKAYKAAIGGLYRNRLIMLNKSEIRLSEPEADAD